MLVRYPDGSSQRLRVSRSGTAIRHRVRLRPGTNVVRLTFQGDGVVDELGRLVYVRLIAPTLVDEAFSPFGRLPALPGCESPLPATSCATTTFA